MVNNKAAQYILNRPLLLSILSGLLLFAAWPMSVATPLIFIAFVPILHIANLPLSRFSFFLYLYIALLIWNVSTTWWIWYASPAGAIGAFVANSLLMCMPWLLYKLVKHKLPTHLAYVALIAFWLCWEYFHLHDWGLSWPWLTVGNVFATHTNWVQWYQYTGVSGGTLWVLLVNVFVYNLITQYKIYKLIAPILAIIIPIIVSFSALPIFSKNSNGTQVVICQPNIDPYTKVNNTNTASQISTLLNTSRLQVDSNTQLLLWPETALYSQFGFNESKLNQNAELDSVFLFLQQYPKLQLFTGIESMQYFNTPTQYSKQLTSSTISYESYNGSVLLQGNQAKAFYHKSMLVPGVETLPSFLNFMGKWFEDLGGTTNGYVKQINRTPIVTNSNIVLAPSICYESIYGGFMSKYIHNGATVIAIITNDGWWRNTPGHQQHFAYAKLRAIENKCYVLRSANTGISGVINPYGQVLQTLPYNTNGAIKATIPISNVNHTLYTKYPDWLYKLAVVVALFILLFYLYAKIFAKAKK